MDHDQEIDVLKRQVKALRQEVQRQGEFIDTVSSPLWKRLWWWFGGYYFRQVGRWYPEGSKAFRTWSWIARRLRLPE